MLNSIAELKPYMISQDELTEFILRQQASASNILASHPRSMAPVLLVVARDCPDGDVEIKESMTLYYLGELDWNDHDVKRHVLRRLGSTYYGQMLFPVAAVLVSEIWQSVQTGDQPLIQPRDDPNRQEGVMVAGMSLNRMVVSSIALVTRDAEQRMTVGEWTTMREGAEFNLLSEFYAGFLQGVCESGKPHDAYVPRTDIN